MITISTGRVVEMSLLQAEGCHTLNVSRGGNDPEGLIFAPTWDMVWGYKRGEMSWEAYTGQYMALMHESQAMHMANWANLILRHNEQTLVLCCYCPPPPAHCHRHLLAKLLVEYANSMGIGAKIEEEKK